tara:strand:- start:9571 stop:11118 length:1548 start_codon:yes stop_codon:yes gene_type:complete
MHIENVRMGFATNSSSSHSIVFGLEGQEDVFPEYGEDEFGWDNFILASKDAKAKYLAVALYSAIEQKIGSDMASAVIKDWCKVSISADAYIDHQSMMGLPADRMRLGGWNHDGDYTISREFFDELYRYYMRKDLVIVGGNDNSYESKPLPNEEHHAHVVGEEINDNWVCRKDGDWWTLMNRTSGTKIRLSFKDKPKPEKYEASTTPELVDIKITDFCPFGCSYCYQDSTKEGKHGDWNQIKTYVEAFGEQGLFELAIGGGEPTMYPQFAELLKLCRQHGIIANFTTRSLHWFKDRELVDLVNDSVGRFAYSVESAEEMFRIATLLKEAGVRMSGDSPWYRSWDRSSSRLSFQYVMGTAGEIQFRDVINAARILQCDLTLLGFKEVGRGSGYSRKDYGYWLDIVRDNRYSMGSRIGIDTSLAQEFEEQLLEDERLKTLMTTQEGVFSMYVDAVANKVGPSSYCEDKDYVPIDFESHTETRDWNDRVYIKTSEIDMQMRQAFRGFKRKAASCKKVAK